MFFSTAFLMGGAENFGESGDVGWEELSEAPPTDPSFLGETKEDDKSKKEKK